jgi:sulfatase modifying factor 1
MKYFRILAMLLVAATLTFSACDGGGTDSTVTDSTVADGDAILTIAAIPGVMSPVLGETPVTEITETAQYTGTVSWAPADNPFDYETEYTATITLTAKSGYTLTGVEANFFTVAGATTVSNTADTGVITAIFPATLAPPAGANIAYTLPSSISFNMKYVPGGTFPTGTDDLGGNQTISTPYWMAETEVTYELWYAVRTWATTTGGYTFANAGVQGDSGAGTNQHPVTTINWRDSMVWCNALTEYYNANNGTGTNLDCVYYTDSGYTTPQRSSADGTYGSSVNATTGSFDEPYVKAAAKGFRLPGSMEWECAARYRGSDTTNSILNTGVYWTKGNSASGATDYAYTTADNPLDTAGESGPSRTVAWYSINSGSVTKPVAGKTANALGIRDMSGNVWEWCFDWHPSYVGSYRVLRGGSWGDSASGLRVGGVYDLDPYLEFSGVGFRFVSTGALMSIKLFKDNLPVSAQVQIP